MTPTPNPQEAATDEMKMTDEKMRQYLETLQSSAYIGDGDLIEVQDVLRIFNRLSLAERRAEELQRESEWRGLLVKAFCVGWQFDPLRGRLFLYGAGIEVDLHMDANGLPIRPSDEIVEKIKGAIQ